MKFIKLPLFYLIANLVSLNFAQAATFPSNSVKFGDGTASNKSIFFNIGGTNPAIRWNNATGQLQFSNNGSTFINFLAASFVVPTIQKFLSGSGTYTTPTNPAPIYIRVTMVGGGGGGGPGGNSSGSSNGGSGGATTFGTTLLSAGGGVGATLNNQGAAGGTSSLGSGPIGIALPGGSGGTSPIAQVGGTGITFSGGVGGSSAFAGSGYAGLGNGVAGGAGGTNTGGGGGGGGELGSATDSSGAGGGAGGYIDAIITSPSATYLYAVGAGGIAGTASLNGTNGGAGGSGLIIVTEYYQ